MLLTFAQLSEEAAKSRPPKFVSGIEHAISEVSDSIRTFSVEYNQDSENMLRLYFGEILY